MIFLNSTTATRWHYAALLGIFLACSWNVRAQASPFTDCKAEDQVPTEVAAISAVLRVCDKVGAVSRRQVREGVRPQEFAAESAIDVEALHSAVAAALPAMDRNLAKSNLSVGLLSAKLSEQTARYLKWSAALIGGLGSGVGGGLRLVNDKAVMHDGTVVGIIGGGLGATINIIAALPTKKETPDAFADLIPASVRSYIQKSDPNLNFGTFRKKPSALSEWLIKMRHDADCLMQYPEPCQ